MNQTLPRGIRNNNPGNIRWGTLARVTGIKPRSGKVEITAVIEDNRVHAN